MATTNETLPTNFDLPVSSDRLSATQPDPRIELVRPWGELARDFENFRELAEAEGLEIYTRVDMPKKEDFASHIRPGAVSVGNTCDVVEIAHFPRKTRKTIALSLTGLSVTGAAGMALIPSVAAAPGPETTPATHAKDFNSTVPPRVTEKVKITSDGNTAYVVNSAGEITSAGNGTFQGLAPELAPGEVVTSLLIEKIDNEDSTLEVTNRGRVITNRKAVSFGDFSGKPLNAEVGDAIMTPSGKGYWLLAKDGGILSFGDAKFYGSTGNIKLNKPAIGLAGDPDGAGYWAVASDGGIFAFDAVFKGSMGDKKLNQPVVGMIRYGNGYLMVAADGGIFNFSDKPFYGSLGDKAIDSPIVSVAAPDDGAYYVMVSAKGQLYAFGNVPAAIKNSPNVKVFEGPSASVAPTPPTPPNNGNQNAPEIVVANLDCGQPPSLWFDRINGDVNEYKVSISNSLVPSSLTDPDVLDVHVRPNKTPNGTPDRSNIDTAYLLNLPLDAGTSTTHISIKTADGAFGKEINLQNTADTSKDPARCPKGQDQDMTIRKYPLDRIG